jgi:1-acylglycerone phosphate reductase
MAPKSVLITGCSAGGIGYALAQQFQKRGLTVFATARSLSKMEGLKALQNTVLLSLDVTSPSDIASAVSEVKARTGGKLDYLVNNSAQAIFVPALDQDIDEGKEMFDVNFWGTLRMIQAFAPLLIEAKGTVANIGSINGILHPPFSSEKHATMSLARILTDKSYRCLQRLQGRSTQP